MAGLLRLTRPDDAKRDDRLAGQFEFSGGQVFPKVFERRCSRN